MLIFLIHIRDPQFYAMPAAGRAKNGNIRVMGFPPIGIMSLASVLKRAGHECVMFDQANPETPNHVIIDEIRRRQPQLVGLSFLSTTSYPYAKILARQIRAADSSVKLAFGGVFATLNASLVKLQCPEVDFVCRGDGEQLILDLLESDAAVFAVFLHIVAKRCDDRIGIRLPEHEQDRCYSLGVLEVPAAITAPLPTVPLFDAVVSEHHSSAILWGESDEQ